jgi:hypothetical protein
LIAPSDDPYLTVGGAEELSDYQLCYWYCLEISLRAQLYREAAEQLGLKVASLSIDDLNKLDILSALVSELHLTSCVNPSHYLRAFVGTRVNRSAGSHPVLDEQHYDIQEDQVHSRIVDVKSVDSVFRKIQLLRR